MLVFHSIWTDLAQAGASRDFVVVTDYPKQEQRPHKLRWAIGIFVTAMALALSTLLPVPLALMGGAAAMIATGVINMDEAYAATDNASTFDRTSSRIWSNVSASITVTPPTCVTCFASSRTESRS